MKALFVINERSGSGQGLAVGEMLRKSAGFDSEVLSCGRKEDLDGIVETAEQNGVEVVFAVGGDGTVHETARRLIGRKPALGIIPVGSGNGFARHIGLPMRPEDALAACARGRIETVDTAAVNGAAFVGVMGLGFDALIAERFAESGTRGFTTYLWEGLRAIPDREAETYEIVHDGGTVTETAAIVAVANSAHYGNGVRIAPHASLTDGLLDVVVVRDPGLLGAPALVLRLFNGTVDQAEGVSCFQTTAATIRRSTPGRAHLDGEPVTLPAELNVSVNPRSLRLLMPG